MTERQLESLVSDIVLADGVSLEDDWFAVAKPAPSVIAIGEPAYHQRNWSYLINGDTHSLLFDTGSGRRDIAPVVHRHRARPLKVLPSHLHFDHLGGINRFGPVLLADLPEVRACATDGKVTPTEQLFLGSYEDLDCPTFDLAGWVAPGEVIELGGVALEVLHTPGHSTDSVSLFWRDEKLLFAADFIYSGGLYGQTPGADLNDYLRTARYLADILPADTRILCAHGQPDSEGRSGPPEHDLTDIAALAASLNDLRLALGQASAPADGIWPVKGSMHLIYSAQASACWRD